MINVIIEWSADCWTCYQLSEYEMSWQPEYSLAFGGFDRATACPAADKRTNEINHVNTHECCGQYPERFPLVYH